MKRIICFAVITMIALTGFSQVPLKSIVEHFTNTKCSVCGSRNPGFYTNYNSQSGINYLSIHPSAPYIACPLSMQNKVDNDARTNYYGVYGSTPRLVINGEEIPSNANYNDPALFSPYLGLTTPIAIRIEQKKYASDSMVVNVTIKKMAAISGTALLFAGIVEDTVFVDGGNGEKEHYNVFRQSLAVNTDSIVDLNFPIGDSLVYKYNVPIKPIWNAARLKAVAILQNQNTKQVLQSEMSNTNEGIIATVEQRTSNKYLHKIYPNPAKDKLYIEVGNKNQSSASLYSITGQLIQQKIFNQTTTLEISNMPSGLYLLKIESAKEIAWEKIAIEK